MTFVYLFNEAEV